MKLFNISKKKKKVGDKKWKIRIGLSLKKIYSLLHVCLSFLILLLFFYASVLKVLVAFPNYSLSLFCIAILIQPFYFLPLIISVSSPYCSIILKVFYICRAGPHNNLQLIHCTCYMNWNNSKEGNSKCSSLLILLNIFFSWRHIIAKLF